MTGQLRCLEFDALDGWAADDHLAAFETFCRSARRMVEKPPTTRKLGADGAALAAVGALALAAEVESSEQARQFFEHYFTPHHIEGEGLLTGFFEPVVEASLTPSAEFAHPLYTRPDWLVDVDDANRPESWSPDIRYGRLTADGLVEAPDRAAVMDGALDGQGLEMVWLRDPVDAFFINVQGAARLAMSDGTTRRITYAAKSGHAYTSIAKLLCARDGIDPATMTADKLADWMRTNPEDAKTLLRQNRSFIFFAFSDDNTTDPSLGQIAAAKVQLTPRRSMAVDRLLHTFHTPVFINSTEPLPGDTSPLARLMVAQDTGSAITGAVRGDIFTGSGDAAGLIAGRVRHPLAMTVLMPKVVPS
ncbi:murein transglycosylase A [Ahrensia sp. R2A130]|uniref:murein transglycosylase A n=1 Tax=Ahrensia sp. R2A130 TaxID=744979 RepID=UPI0001E0B4A3|nr:MltA domain-containing protein [Ahrensia sp. R2A130]EFL89728.1 outer membrane lipoprotein GNA33, membrane-bound lytic murein transglycosylase [Ahrensia sp. R2A130]